MGMNFLRSCSLQVGGFTVPGGGPTDLRITFSIEQTTIQSPNPAHFRVYNVSASTASQLKAKEGTKVTFSAGYNDNVGIVYIGDLKQFIGSGHETVVDSYVDLFCAGGDVAYNQARVTKTLAAGWTPKDKLKVAMDAMKGISMGLSNIDLSQPKFPRGLPMIGMARDIVREVALAKRATFCITNDKLDLINPKMPVQSNTIEMNSKSGMVGWAKQTPDGIVTKSLINSALRPHVMIHLNESDIIGAEQDNNPLTSAGSQSNFNLNHSGILAPDGIYRIISLKRTGDTRAQDWYDDAVCISSSSGSATQAQKDAGLTLGNE